ncbi:hypothetical protein ACSFV5_07290 [Acinetobacter sp. HC8-3S]
MLRPLTGFMKSRKRNEPLPKEQADHNKKQVKLLQRIADNLQSKGGLLGGIGKLLGAGGGIVGGLLGSLGGLFKKGGKGLSKILKFGKGIPVIGALLTAMSFSGWDKKNTKEKGGTVGSAVGGIAGGALGSLLGPLGTIAGAAIGSWVGEKLGGIVAPYVKEWTDSLINADLPNKIFEFFSKVFSFTPAGTAVKAAKTFADWGKGVARTVGDTVSQAWNDTVRGGEPKKGAQPGDAYNSSKLGKYQLLADAIAKGEGTYTSVNTGGNPSKRVKGDFQSKNIPNLTDMTIDEILKANEKPFGDSNRINAAGKYQIIASTLKNVKKDMGLTGKEKFTPELQDKMFMHLLPQSAKNYVEGKSDNKKLAISDISSVWSSVANPNTGKTSHQDGVNKASPQSVNRVSNALDYAKTKPNIQPAIQIISNTRSPIARDAESIMQKVKRQTSTLSSIPAVTPLATRSQSIAASYTPPKLESKIQPAKEYLTSPKPQEVVVKNQNNGTINQNVSNRLLAHAITGGLGMGIKWNG